METVIEYEIEVMNDDGAWCHDVTLTSLDAAMAERDRFAKAHPEDKQRIVKVETTRTVVAGGGS